MNIKYPACALIIVSFIAVIIAMFSPSQETMFGEEINDKTVVSIEYERLVGRDAYEVSYVDDKGGQKSVTLINNKWNTKIKTEVSTDGLYHAKVADGIITLSMPQADSDYESK